MGARSIERKLRKVGTRLRQLRDELAVVDEQLAHLADDTDEKSLRALLGDNAEAAHEYRQAAGHSEAMAEHRRRLLAEISTLDKKQDELLDELRLR
jgi:hypothetical protein